MRGKLGKIVTFMLIISITASLILNSEIFAESESEESFDTYDVYDDSTFISMDEDGNVTLIPVEEIETPDAEELSKIDNVYYEIIVAVEGEESVVNVVETEDEADNEVEMIQEIIDEQPTVEAAIEEIAVVTENEAVIELVETNTTALEIDVEEAQTVQESTDETGTATYSVTVESPSTQSAASDKAITVTSQKVTYEVTYGVVEFKSSSDIYTFTDVNDGTYINYLYEGMAPDAAYLGTTSDGQVMFMQSGVVGLIDASYVNIYSYSDFVDAGYTTSYYYTSQGKLYHAITTNMKTIASTQVFGYQQEYMTDNTTYYSYDGHYFYTSYKTMIKDYKNNTYENAVNADDPYYNYYLYLSHRTTTEFTEDEINDYIDYRINLSSTDSITSKSKLADIADDLIKYQDKYGVNALLMLGVAINESGWGMSTYAQDRNNLFGHSAYDSDPDSADTYSSVAEGIMYHARNFISYGYTDVVGDSRYHGSHLGNKQSGMNVKYASDPYWGEKAAANCWLIEMYYSDEQIDAYSEDLGIVNNSAQIYESPNGAVLYELKNKNVSTSWEMPVVILESYEIDGVLWYKIQSDTPVKNDRSDVYCYATYSFEDDYVYIMASDVYIVYGEVILEEYVEPEANEEDEYVIGDATGDDKITSADYIAIKNHIMGTKTISSKYQDGADANQDGKISSADYIAIKNHIMGTKLIK